MSILDDFNKAQNKLRAKKKENAILEDFYAEQKKIQSEKKEKPLYTGKTDAIYEDDGDIAPITTTTKKDEERKWFQKGEFDDGYQLGDITKTILGTKTDISENLLAGVLGMGEKAVDAGAYIVGGVGGLFGNDDLKDKMSGFIKKDLYDEEKVAKKIIGLSDYGMLNDMIGVDSEYSSVLGEKSDALVQSAGQLAGTLGLQAVGVPWFVTSGVVGFGSEAENALNQGASYGRAGMSAAISAGAEILTEKLFGGSGLGETGLIAVDRLTKGITNKAVKALADYGVDILAEGSEEVISEFMSNLGSSLYKEKNLGEILFSEEAIDGYIESFIGGGVLGGVMNASNAVSSVKSGRDYRSGLSVNEQKVVQKEVENRIAEQEKGGKKLTKKEKAALEEAVIRDMEKGYISTDTIEEVLGGESYNTYKRTVDYEDSLLNEFTELNRMKQADMTGEQIDRRMELKQQLEDIKQNSKRDLYKSNLSDNVLRSIQNDRLTESYNERSRRGQAFEADLSKYDTKQQETIKKAVESGILNNTNRTHEFVDMIAKITADKGVLFDFTNNERLKESGFAVDGKAVNGYVTKDGVTLNIDSAKSLNSVVGHEITHVLEGTELYTALQSAVTEYAKTKGDYQGRYDSLSKLYEGVDGADVDAELTADLVGDYLFTDEDFVRNLSVQHRNVFQKIYDEIKYLCKVATAGSKEARELEKVKRAFEKAYQESGKTEGTKYSLSESDFPNNAEDVAKEYFGTTTKWSETGWLLQDGTQLDFSGRHWERDPENEIELGESYYSGKRNVEHYEIAEAFPELREFSRMEYRGEHLDRFLSRGNIRIVGKGIVDIEKMPTEEQFEKLHSYFSENINQHIIVGVGQGCLDFNAGTNPSVIVEGIRDYFAHNRRHQSELMQFHTKYSLSDSDGKQLTNEQQSDGDFKVMDGGAVTKYSLSTWTPETQEKVRANLVKAGYEGERVDKWIKDVNSIASVIAADKGRLDFVAADNQVMLKNNEEYVKTLDASTLCAKRLVYQGTFDAIQHRMPNTMLSSDDLIDLLNMMKEHNVQTPCGVCYVESRRRHLGKFAQEWLNGYNGEYKPNLDEVTTSDGLEALRKSHPDTYDDFITAMNKKGSSNPKVVQLRTEYRNEIMSLTPAQIRKIEAIGGLRVQSFSDFETPHMLDMMQAVMDMSAKGLHSQAYTKVPNFAWVFGDTGIKINLSLIAEGNGFDSDGNLAFSSVEGMDIDEAMKLRDAYSENVGTIIVGANDKHILACMADDRIDFIIPFHRSGWGMKELDMMGMSSYTDYTYGQKEHDLATGKGVANLYPPDYWDYNLSGKENAERYLNLCAKTGREPKFSHFLVNNGDGSYSLQPDGSTDGYWKTLIDFKMYDNDGNGAAQQKVQPNFNMEEAYRVLNEYEGGANSLPVANDVVEEFVAKYQNKKSLSRAGEEFAPIGNFNVYGKDMKLETAPAAEPVTEVTEVTEPMFPDDLAPMADDPERFDSLTDADMPPETDAPYTEDGEVTVDDPFEERDWYQVGNRKVNAYMYENPEVKPYFQEEAAMLLSELKDTIKGEKWYNDDLYYQTNGEQGFGGTKRLTSDSIAEMLDVWGMSYADIEKGLNAIIEDHGAENIAAAKKIEFMLNDRLLNGYKDFYSNGMTPPNEEYINLLNEKQITEYSKEAFDAFMANADSYAPPVEEDIAPVSNPSMPVSERRGPYMAANAPVEKYEAIRPKMATQPRMARATTEEQARAEILVDEPKVDKKKKNGLWNWAKVNLIDPGTVFETLSLKSGNPELQAKFSSIKRAESRAQRFMENGNGMTSSLKSIRESVEKTGKTKQFYEYLYHLHNADRMTLEDRYSDVENKPVFGSSITADISNLEVAELEKRNPEFKRLAKEVYNYMGNLREMLVEGGVISEETAQLWQEMYPHYVPIRREGYDGVNINVPLDTGRTGINAPVKRAKGGNSNILPLFDTMAQRTIQTFKAVAKNRFGVELKNTLGTAIGSEAMSLDEAIEGVDTHEELLQEGKNGRSPTFTVFENGEKVTFEITDEMYDAMKPKSGAANINIKALNAMNNWRRGLITEYNPVFAITNPIKDIQDVLINSKHPARTYANMPKAIGELLSNGHWYREYLDNGGEQNTYFEGETNTFVKEKSTLRKVVGFPIDKLSQVNNFIEKVPRLAEYIASRKAGRSIDVSMLDAARVTTDFSAGGHITKMMNRNGFTFLNASVQGAVQQVRNIREAKHNGLKGWAQLAAKTVAAGLPAILLNHLLWEDDEEYEELSDYVKQNYYIVGKFGDGKFVRIPKGRTLAVIQNGFEQMENLITGNDEADLEAFTELVISNLAPNNPLDNNIIAPIAQALRNETWYGEDLVPTRLQDLPSAEQYDESTDVISRWLGERTPFSPYKINYLLDQYSGGLGDTFLPMLTPKAESGDDTLKGYLLAPLRDKFTTDAVMNNQNVSDFYDKKDELTVNANASGATDEDVLKNKYMNSVNADLAKLYAEKRKIQNSDLPDSEKYAAVRDVQSQIVALTRESLGTYENISYEEDDIAVIGDKYFKQNDDGEWSKLSDEQVTKYEATSAAGDSDIATDGTTYWQRGEDDEWRKMTDDQVSKYKATTASGDSNYATDGESHWRYHEGENGNESEWRKLDDEQVEKQEMYTHALNISAEDYWQYTEDIGNFDAKDENGKTVSGLKKERVYNYIFNELDIDYGAKCILYRSQYDSKADKAEYNQDIVDYLNSRDDISYEEMEAILKKLDFTVSADGTISW